MKWCSAENVLVVGHGVTDDPHPFSPPPFTRVYIAHCLSGIEEHSGFPHSTVRSLKMTFLTGSLLVTKPVTVRQGRQVQFIRYIA